MLRRLRESNDLSAALSSTQENSSLTIQPSNIRNARAISPPTGFATEFELAAQFSMAYPRIPPHDIQVLRGLLRQNNDDETRTVQKITRLPLPSISQDSGQTREPKQPGLQKYCDSRLERLQIGYWTNIPISVDFVATLISFYINNDHKIMGFFDADLFLEDLVECRQRFCSSFLVSVVLCMACQGYTAIDSQANEVRIDAFHEAEMLWQGERSDTSLISLAAMGLFSVACIYEGKDVLGQELFLSLRREAERFGLCGGQADVLVDANTLHTNSPEWVREASQIALGVYNWLTIHVIYYGQKYIRHPPAFPISGEGAESPYFLGNMFPNACRLWVIAQEVRGVYSFGKAPVAERVPLAFAEGKYQKLLVWTGILKNHMKRIDGCSPEVMISNSHPKAVYAASVSQLKDLVFSFCSKYSEAAFTAYLSHGLFALSRALLEDLQDPLWRYYFYLCVRCWQDLYFCYPVFCDVAKVFLSMAMQKDAIAAREAQDLLRGIDQSVEHHTTSVEAFTSHIFDPVSDKDGGVQMHAMADRFEEMVVFDELIDKDSVFVG
ncbi:Conidial development protein fluffy [Fusarium oxysporum f. sp. raphani]|uniref:Conidial development protein fluffy n=1 Tax=Fusarium oxysporum f. sp. raphani TaxID=96318 RepID=A0A8J5U0G3_FUSOX|nr:Conidial development protein fluffy [Fusarium oxysporum f. sp. raphani]